MCKDESSSSSPTSAKGGRKKLIADVRKSGFSKRRAGKAVNAVFALISEGLVSDGVVETPIGTFSVRHYDGTEAVVQHRIRNISTGEKQIVEFVQPASRKVIQLHSEIDVTGPEELQEKETAIILTLVEQLLGIGREVPDRVIPALHRRREQTNSTREQLISCLRRLKGTHRVFTPPELVIQMALSLGVPREPELADHHGRTQSWSCFQLEAGIWPSGVRGSRA